MQIKTGCLYHIKDEFFDIVHDQTLMTNHERGKKRPTYFTIKDGNILWFIPLKSAILLQNAFPILKKYIDHVHTIDGIPVKVPKTLGKMILDNFKNLLKLKTKGINLFFTDIDKIKAQMIEAISIDN